MLITRFLLLLEDKGMRKAIFFEFFSDLIQRDYLKLVIITT